MIIDVLEQWRVWRHRIDRVRIALPQGYTTACIWVCIPLFFFVRILVCGDFDRVFIPHVLTYFGFGGHNSYSYTVLFTRAQHENNTKSRLPTRWRTKNYAFFVFFRLFTFPCIHRKLRFLVYNENPCVFHEMSLYRALGPLILGLFPLFRPRKKQNWPSRD